MDPYRESLARRYAELSDADLRQRLERDELAETPREIALAELHSRGLSLRPHAARRTVPLPLPLPQDVEFAADRFAANPYQTPRADLLDTPSESRSSRIWNTLWWAYTAFMILYTLRVVLMKFGFGRLPNVEVIVMLALMVLACLGLIGWRTRRRFLRRAVWMVAALLTGLFAGLFVLASAVVLFNGTASPIAEALPLWLVLTMTAAVLPLPWALSRYAFEKSIW